MWPLVFLELLRAKVKVDSAFTHYIACLFFFFFESALYRREVGLAHLVVPLATWHCAWHTVAEKAGPPVSAPERPRLGRPFFLYFFPLDLQLPVAVAFAAKSCPFWTLKDGSLLTIPGKNVLNAYSANASLCLNSMSTLQALCCVFICH